MAHELGRPVEGVAYVQDVTRNKLSKMEDGKAVAKKLTTTDHVPDRATMVGLGSRPVLIQRNADDLTFRSPAEQLIVDGTVATMSKLSATDSVSAPIEQAMPRPPGDPVPERVQVQPQAPQAIVTIPVAQASIQGFPQGAILEKAVAPVKKTMVVIEGDNLGKLRVFCQDVVVTEKMLILVYSLDGATAVVEPPAGNTENLLTITVGKDRYKTASLGMSFEFNGCLFVLLVRA